MTKEENMQIFADTVQSCQKESRFLNGQEIPLKLTSEQMQKVQVPAALQAGLALKQDTLQVNGRTMPAYFFHDEDKPNGFLSNWYPSVFTLDGLQFSSAEQYIMYRKCMVFADTDRAAAVLAAETPVEQKEIAHNTEYNEKVWNGIRQPAAMRGLQAKFSQNPILLEALLNTGDAYLVECSKETLI